MSFAYAKCSILCFICQYYLLKRFFKHGTNVNFWQPCMTQSPLAEAGGLIILARSRYHSKEIFSSLLGKIDSSNHCYYHYEVFLGREFNLHHHPCYSENCSETNDKPIPFFKSLNNFIILRINNAFYFFWLFSYTL